MRNRMEKLNKEIRYRVGCGIDATALIKKRDELFDQRRMEKIRLAIRKRGDRKRFISNLEVDDE